jgi:hypothetical protein
MAAIFPFGIVFKQSVIPPLVEVAKVVDIKGVINFLSK